MAFDGWPGLSVMRRVPRPRFLRAGLGSRLSLSKTRNPELPRLSPSNPAAYADFTFVRVLLDKVVKCGTLYGVENCA
jgi:hypothetical protein